MSVSMLDLATQSGGSGPEGSGPDGSGHLAENVMHFARVLRDAGLRSACVQFGLHLGQDALGFGAANTGNVILIFQQCAQGVVDRLG